MTKEDRKQTTAYNHVRDAIELKAVASAASVTKGARRVGGVIRQELRDRAARYIIAARAYSPAFTRRVWMKHRTS